MDSPAYHFQVLYPLQDRALAVCRRVDTGFYLTGGTLDTSAHLAYHPPR